MLTKEVEFNGDKYAIRNNMRTKMLFQKEVKKTIEADETEVVLIYAWCLLRGYNKFYMDFEEFTMYVDDDANINFLKAATEVISADNVEEEADAEEASDEKK